MISKSQAKFIKSLQLKKYRKQEQCFIVDGEKGAEEVIHSDYEVLQLVATKTYADQNQKLIEKSHAELLVTSDDQLAQLSSFQNNSTVLAVVKQKPNQLPYLKSDEFALVLDDIRDPGNLGTIIRTADWFGLRKIWASQETADFYSPKVINASMGSFTRVQFGYTELSEELAKTGLPVYGTFMKGENVHEAVFESSGFIVLGNEAQGISKNVEARITHRLTIPGVKGAESLNAAVAAGIIMDNWSRLKK